MNATRFQRNLGLGTWCTNKASTWKVRFGLAGLGTKWSLFWRHWREISAGELEEGTKTAMARLSDTVLGTNIHVRIIGVALVESDQCIPNQTYETSVNCHLTLHRNI